MRLLLIRHGQTPNNVRGALDTAFPGAGLTPLGEAQAAAVPRALDGQWVGRVYASSRVRTQLTATPLARARGLEVEERAGFEEIAAGDLEMLTDADAVHAYAECIGAWMHGDLERRMPGGTTGREFYTAYDAAVRAVASEAGPDETPVVFSHGAAIRAYTTLAAGVDPAVAIDMRIMNTGMAMLDGDPDGGWRLSRWSAEPLGGVALADDHAHDVTGESTDEALHES